MHKFVLNLVTEWRKLSLPFEKETVVSAVSGGADSLALLLALDDLRTREKLELRIVAAHFNHMLRGRESDKDEEFVKQVAVERNFELAVGRGPVGHEGNLEQNARDARYAFLAATAGNLRARYVLTAHTMNDQAEAFLLNLIRGSGPDGLSGMRPVREMTGETGDVSAGSRPAFPISCLLVRPLLRWARRDDTENYCRESGIEFRYDTMNEDVSFKRVRVRKMLLPMLKEFNPKIIETLAQTAELMQQSSEPLASAGGPDTAMYASLIPEELLLKELKTLETADLYLRIRSWLKKHRGGLRSVGVKHIKAIEHLIHSTKSGRTVELPGFGLVRRQNGRLSFENLKVDK